jgi:hypothetical protein
MSRQDLFRLRSSGARQPVMAWPEASYTYSSRSTETYGT